MPEHPSDSIQVWSLQDGRLAHTLSLLPGEPARDMCFCELTSQLVACVSTRLLHVRS